MKHVRHIWPLSILLLLMAAGCKDFTTQPNLGNQQLKDYFSTPTSASQFVNGTYQSIGYNNWWKTNFFRQLNAAATDDAWLGNIGQWSDQYAQFGNFNLQSNNGRIKTYWKWTYIAITRANISIEKIPEVNFQDKKIQKRLVAESKFLRSLFYFQLAENFSVKDSRAKDGRGGVPIVSSYSQILKPNVYKYKRQTKDSLFKFIDEGFMQAASALPTKGQYSKSEMGRATRGTALGYLGKSYMTQHKYKKAKNVLQKVIDSGQYHLNSNYADIWSVNNDNGPGTLFAIKHQNNASFKTGGVYGVTSQSRNDPYNGWDWDVPTSNLEREYKQEGDSIRLHATIMKTGQPVYDKNGNVLIQQFDAGGVKNNKSGRIWRKFYVPVKQRPKPYGRGYLPKDMIMLRYADILLLHAEAAYRTGDQGVALKDLKKVRDRVNLETDMSLSGKALRNAIWNERRMELGGEFHRLNDLRREMKNGKPRLAYTMGSNGSFVKYNTQTSTDKFETSRTSVEPQDEGSGFDYPNDLAWPIPAATILRSNGRIKQNPGY